MLRTVLTARILAPVASRAKLYIFDTNMTEELCTLPLPCDIVRTLPGRLAWYFGSLISAYPVR